MSRKSVLEISDIGRAASFPVIEQMLSNYAGLRLYHVAVLC